MKLLKKLTILMVKKMEVMPNKAIFRKKGKKGED